MELEVLGSALLETAPARTLLVNFAGILSSVHLELSIWKSGITQTCYQLLMAFADNQINRSSLGFMCKHIPT